MNVCLDNERQFFETVLNGLTAKDDLTTQFQQHIAEIETQYHKDQQGQFKTLWPELSFLCK